MKPQEHISPESWRHEDAALRRALQQRNNALPQLPEGFAEKIVAQLPEGMPAQEPKQSAADLNTPSFKRAHRLLLWPMTAAAAVIAALFISLPSLIHEQPEHDEVAKAPERSAIISTPDHPERPAQAPEHPAITSTPDHPLMAQATRHPSSTNRFPQSEPSAAPTSEVTTLQSETSASQISRVTTAPIPPKPRYQKTFPRRKPPPPLLSAVYPPTPLPHPLPSLPPHPHLGTSTSPSPSPPLPPALTSPSTTPTTTLLPPPTKIPPQRLPTHIIPTMTNTTSPQATATPTPSNLPPAVATIPETLALPHSDTSKKRKPSTRASTACPSPPR